MASSFRTRPIEHETAVLGEKTDPVALENEKVAGAVRTDLILSAEIMALTLSTVADASMYMQGVVLAAVGIAITLAVYGVVGLIVKADDAGVALAKTSVSALRAIGRGLVVGMPIFLKVLAAIGTAAMLWGRRQHLVHGLAQMGYASRTHHPRHLRSRGPRAPKYPGSDRLDCHVGAAGPAGDRRRRCNHRRHGQHRRAECGTTETCEPLTWRASWRRHAWPCPGQRHACSLIGRY